MLALAFVFYVTSLNFGPLKLLAVVNLNDWFISFDHSMSLIVYVIRGSVALLFLMINESQYNFQLWVGKFFFLP